MGNKELGIADPVYDALRIRSGQSIAPDLGSGIPPSGGAGLENKIYLWHSDGSAIDTFDPDATGLGLALAGAVSGDTVWLPSMTIALTAGITIPVGVTVVGIDQSATLSFSGFSGTGVTLSTYSALWSVTVLFNGTGYASATAIGASADGWVIHTCGAYAHDASANNYGINAVALTAVERAFISNSSGHGLGTNARGIICGDHVTIGNGCTARTSGTDATSAGLHITAAAAKPAIVEWLRGHGKYACIVAAGASAEVRHTSFIGNTTGLIINATGALTVEDVAWNSISNSGTLTYRQGSRGNYSVEDYHASDIEAGTLTRHHTLPTGSAADAGKADVLNASGTAWVLGNTSISPEIGAASAAYSESNVSNPPNESDIIGAFGEVATVGPGYLGILNDNAGELNVYLCGATIMGWWYLNLAKAAALIATALSILAGDSFTDTNGTHLNAHTMDAGAGWTESSGSWTISSNAAVQATAGGAGYLVTTETNDANVKIHARMKTSGASGSFSAGIVARFSDTSNLWIIDYGIGGSSVFRITEIAAGVPTVRASKSFTARYQKYIDIDVTLNGNVISATFDGGYGLTYTSSFNNTATKHGLTEYRDGSFGSNVFEDFQINDLPTYAWTRTGTVLSATESWETGGVGEPTVLYDADPQILTADKVFKMWYTGGWTTPGIGYAESDDNGATWTKYTGNPILSNTVLRSIVVKFDGAYYMYGANAAGNKVVLYTSSNGISWASYGDLLSLGAGGSWDASVFGNIFVWRESLTAYYMLYEAKGASNEWKIGLATSTDGLTWTKSGSNPVLSIDGGSIGGPFVKKIGTYYYLWAHRSAPVSIPSYVARYRSSNLTTWTPWPAAPIFTRSGSAEGEDTYVGQDGDIHILDRGATAYAFFSGSADGTDISGDSHIILATADVRAIGGY